MYKDMFKNPFAVNNGPFVVTKPDPCRSVIYNVVCGNSTVLHGGIELKKLIKSYGFTFDHALSVWLGGVNANKLEDLLRQINAENVYTKAAPSSVITFDFDIPDSKLPMKTLELPPGTGRTIVYSCERSRIRGRPTVWLHGPGIETAEEWLVEEHKFWFNNERFALCNKMSKEQLNNIFTLLEKRDYVIKAKKDMSSYLVLPNFSDRYKH